MLTLSTLTVTTLTLTTRTLTTLTLTIRTLTITYPNYDLRLSKLTSEWSPRLALFRRWGRKLRRAVARLLRSPHSRGVGVRLSTPGVDIDTAAAGPCTAATAAAAAGDGVFAQLAAWAEFLEPGAAEAPATLADRLALTRHPPTPQGYVAIDARRTRDARVHALLLPIAEQLAACFGLQRAQRDDI